MSHRRVTDGLAWLHQVFKSRRAVAIAISLSVFIGWQVATKSIAAQLIAAQPNSPQQIPPIARTVPPPGIDIPAKTRDALNNRLMALQAIATDLRLDKNPSNLADADVLLKAVQFALQHGEFYKESDADKASHLLDLAATRLDELGKDQSPWMRHHGLVVRGFTSTIDGSPQPYGLHIPESLDFTATVPLYVWLHGRGDKATDLHFIHERLSETGQISPDNAIVLHPFGRQCLGFKSAGEIDVLESIRHVQSQYNIDSRRIVLMGFSMGGAGAWHIGAHYNDLFAAVAPGAGFVETAQYNRLKPADFPPVFEQTLWRMYDVPNYVRNLFNGPVVAYSGENDKQIQAARVMEAAFSTHGRQLIHVIGPGMEHKYHPESLAEILRKMDDAIRQGQNERPAHLYLQTQTLRYNHMHWVTILGLERHWTDTRVDATQQPSGEIAVKTTNVSRLSIDLGPKHRTDNSSDQNAETTITVDGQLVTAPSNQTVAFEKRDRKWHVVTIASTATDPMNTLQKRPGLQGPIDDAFLEPFLVVIPSAESKSPQFQTWLEFEQQHLATRWQELFRGTLRSKLDTDVTDEDIARYNLVLWGDPDVNVLINKITRRLPILWEQDSVVVGPNANNAKSFARSHHVPTLIYPNPLNPAKYVVLNSGPTFREGHDRTNSLQNPKLPDWAVFDINVPPDGFSAGHVVQAGFFDEAWQLLRQ